MINRYLASYDQAEILESGRFLKDLSATKIRIKIGCELMTLWLKIDFIDRAFHHIGSTTSRAPILMKLVSFDRSQRAL